MELEAGVCVLRPWATSDRDALARAADDREVWRNLTDRFPHPYSLRDADEWIARCLLEGRPHRNFAIVVDHQAVGGIGLELPGQEKRQMANLGYWLARSVWNMGIGTAALLKFTEYAFAGFDVERLQASVFAWNPASARILEKCGYVLEGRLRRAVVKGDEVTDELVYGLLRAELPTSSFDRA